MNVARRATRSVAVLALVLATGAARADDEIAALRGRLDQIKELVGEFETRLNALEAARNAPAQLAPPSTVTPPAVTEAPAGPRAQWRRVQALA